VALGDLLPWPNPAPAWNADGATSAAGVSLGELDRVLEVSSAARKALLFLGYQPIALHYHHPGMGDGWAAINLAANEVSSWQAGDADAPTYFDTRPTDGQVHLAIRVYGLDDLRNPGTAMGLYEVPLFLSPHLEQWHYLGDYFVVYGVGQAPTSETLDAPDRRLQQVRAGLDVLWADTTGALADRWVATDRPLAPETASGLLWLVDPTYWRPDLESGTREASSATRVFDAIGRDARAGLPTDRAGALDFLQYQLGLWPGMPLSSVLDLHYHQRFLAREKATLFFDNLRLWAKESTGATLADELLEALAAMLYLEMLVALVNAGVFQPSALVEAADAEWPDEAVASWLQEDGHTVTLVVFGQDDCTVTLERTRDKAMRPVGELYPDEQAVLDGETLEEFFSWEWVVPADGSLPKLLVAAAPGVRIGVPRSSPDWTLEVIRVPYHSMIPAWGETIREDVLLTPYTIAWQPTLLLDQDRVIETVPGSGDTLDLTTSRIPALLVQPTRTGVQLQYPVYEDGTGDAILKLDVAFTDPYSGDDRFAFDLSYYTREEPLMTGFQTVAHVSVWVTRGMKVKAWEHLLAGVGYYLDDIAKSSVWETGDLTRIPELGAPLRYELWRDDMEFVPGWEVEDASPADLGFTQLIGLESTEEVPDWVYDVLDVAISLGLGSFCPIAGDILDAAEFFYALSYGVDKWGRPVTTEQLVLMGVCAALPFVPTGFVRGAGTLITAGLSGASVSSLLLKYVRKVPVDEKEVDDILEYAADWHRVEDLATRQTIRATVKDALELVAEELGTTVRGKYLKLSDLMDPHGKGFSCQALEDSFQRWSNRTGITDRARFAQETSGRSRVVFEALLGNTYVAGKRIHRNPAAGYMWKSSRRIAFKANPPGQAELATRFGEVLDAAVTHVDARTGDDLLYGEPIWMFKTVVDHQTEIERAASSVYRDRINLLLARISTTGNPADVDLATLQKLLGRNKTFHPDELGRMLVMGMDLLEYEAVRLGTTVEDLMKLDAIEGFFYHAIVAKGYEHGSRYELVLASRFLAEGSTASTLRLGLPLPGIYKETLREGPDLVRFTDAGASFVQGKAYQSITALTDVPYGSTPPEIARQLWSDLIRLGNDTRHPWEVLLPGDAGTRRFTGDVTFSVDFEYMYLNQKPMRDFDDLLGEASDNARGLQDQLNAWFATPEARSALGIPADIDINLTIELFYRGPTL
jgi:hypothetical protein